jgi:Bacteriophage minor capsid protein
MNALSLITDYIAAQGLADDAGATGWYLRRGFMPDGPGLDHVVAVFAAGGPGPNIRTDLRTPTVQLRVRGAAKEHDAPFDKLAEITAALIVGTKQQEIAGVAWATPLTEALAIGADDAKRLEFTQHVQVGLG